MKISLKSLIAPHFWNTFNSKITHQIDKGGRGGTKTSKNCLKVVYHTISEDKCSAICIRKYQNTLRNSLFKEIKRAFSRLYLKEDIDYKSSVSPMQIKLYNNNHIYFAGLDDYEKLKGFIDEDRPIKIVYFSEITEFDNEEEMQQVMNILERILIGLLLYEFNQK